MTCLLVAFESRVLAGGTMVAPAHAVIVVAGGSETRSIREAKISR